VAPGKTAAFCFSPVTMSASPTPVASIAPLSADSQLARIDEFHPLAAVVAAIAGYFLPSP
jgi:hypothetical protein